MFLLIKQVQIQNWRLMSHAYFLLENVFLFLMYAQALDSKPRRQNSKPKLAYDTLCYSGCLLKLKKDRKGEKKCFNKLV